MGTWTRYTTPQIPDSDYIHCHSPITSPHQEKWHRSHKVMLDRYHCSAQCKSCPDGDALWWPTRLESFAHNVSTEHNINHILVFCSVWNFHLRLLQLWNHRITEQSELEGTRMIQSNSWGQWKVSKGDPTRVGPCIKHIHVKNKWGQTSKSLLVMVIGSTFLPSSLYSLPTNAREKCNFAACLFTSSFSSRTHFAVTKYGL